MKKEHIDRVGIEFYSRWKEYKILELGKVVTGNTPSSKFPEEFGNVMPFVTPTDYRNYNKWIFVADRNLSDKGINKLKSRVLPANSILVTCIGSDMGKIAINKIPVVTNQQINSIITNEKVNPDFLYYKLVSCYDVLRTYGEAGTAVPIVNKGDFENIEITIPSDLTEQTAIANILTSLDDKIDLLHRQNKTLEQLAETLFRQWFVEEAEESWESKSLGQVFDIGIGRTPPRKEQHWFTLNSNDVKWVSIKDMGTSGLYIDTVSEYLTQEAINQFSVPVIPENTVMLSFKMTIGRLAISTETMVSNEAIAHFKNKEGSFLFPEFLYLFLKTYSWLELGSTSSIVESINSQMIKEIVMIIPDKEKLINFKKLIKPYFDKIKSNQTQIRSLTQLRDTLLPKLMSGEVRVEMN